MSTGRKIALGILISVVTLLAILAILIPYLIDIDRYRPQVVAEIQEETGKPASIGRLSLTILPALSIRVDDFAVGNPAGFPSGPFLKARRIYVLVDARALWDRRVVITSLELNGPAIELLSDVRGRWNFESPPKARVERKVAQDGPTPFALGVISRILVSGGQLSAANLLASGRRGPTYFDARNVAIELEQVDLNAFMTSAAGMSFPLQMFASRRAGWGGRLDEPLDGSPEDFLTQAPRPALGFLLGPTYAYAADAGKRPAAQGTLKAGSLQFGSLQATSVKSKLRLFPKQIFIDELNFDLYGGQTTGALSFNFAGQNPRYNTQVRLSGVDVAKLLEAFPEGRGKMSGKMEGNLKLSGEVTHSPDPLAGMHGTGQVSVRDGQLPSLQLNKNLTLLARVANVGPAEGDPSSFSLLSADLNVANMRITSNKVILAGNGVDVEASGSLGLAGEGSLDYEGVAKLVAGQSAVSNFLASLSGATMTDGKLSFPFSIGGTLEHPKVLLKTSGGKLEVLQNGVAAKSGAQPAQQPGQTQQKPVEVIQGIAGLFKKKQPAQQTTEQPK